MRVVKIISHAPLVPSYVVEGVTVHLRPGAAFKTKDGAVFYLQATDVTDECTGGQIEVWFAPSGGAGTRELVIDDELEAV
jgi:hypothetical protein